MTSTNYRLSGAALIFIICLLSFGLQIPTLGFYWDDYASIYVFEKYGSEVFTDWVGGQGRPLGGVLIGALWKLFGIEALPWHVLNFGLYVGSVLVFWGILQTLFPKFRVQTLLTALVFAVYPSYHLRPIPISFSLIASLVLLLLSFWLMLVAVQQKKLWLNMVAAILIPLYPLIYEQGIIYEVLRPLAIGFVLGLVTWGAWRNRWREVLPYWIPHFVAGIVYVVYRGAIFHPNETYASYNTPSYLHSLDGLVLTFKLSVATPAKMIVWDWLAMPWRLFVTDASDLDIPGSLAIIALVACLVYLWRYPDDLHFRQGKVIGAMAIIGFVMMAGLLVAVHLVGRVLEPGFNSRWALLPSPLAALIIGLGIPYLIRSVPVGQLVLVGLVALGVGTQVAVNQEYADDWSLRRELWWQMRWRTPLMEPDTMVIFVDESGEMAFDRHINDYELTGHSNLFYGTWSGERVEQGVNPYPRVVAGEPNMIANILSQQKSQSGVWSQALTGNNVIFRDWNFDFDKVVVFGYEGGCLITATPSTQYQAMESQTFRNLAFLQNNDVMLDHGLAGEDFVSYASVVEPEAPRTWCFYYQQVQWALQHGYDAPAVSLADAVQREGLKPEKGHEVEWVPFIEAYNRVGRFEDATLLVNLIAFQDTANPQQYLCERLVQLQEQEGINLQAQIDLLGACND